MKKTISLICAVAMLIALLSLSACNKKADTVTLVGDDISGDYRLTEIILENKSYDPADVGFENVKLKIDGDTAVLSGLSDTDRKMDIDTDKMEMKDGDTAIPYAVDGKKLTLNMDEDFDMVFEKQ